jgi:chloramphenicol 3-O phosphotransferase
VSGRVVILNGAGSVGKSSLASEFHDLRAARGEFWFRAGIDDVLAKVTFPWLDIGWPAGPGAHADQGLRIVPSSDGDVMDVGPLLRELLHTYQDGAAVNARRGVDVLVDEACLDAALHARWGEVLADLDVQWVAVRCAPEEMARREAARGDRPIGLAAALANTVHRGVAYDGEIDTTARSPRDLAVELDELVQRISTT